MSTVMKSFIMMLIAAALVTGCDPKKVDVVDSTSDAVVADVVVVTDVIVEVASDAVTDSDTGK